MHEPNFDFHLSTQKEERENTNKKMENKTNAVKRLMFLQKKILILTILRRRAIQSRADERYRKRTWVRRIFQEREQRGAFSILVFLSVFFIKESFSGRLP